MAGLLDIFGTGGTDTLGLLGMSAGDIQRNREDAQAQALYGLAARLFQGGNTGQSIAEGLQQGQKLYKGAMQEQLQEQLQGFQMKDLLEKRKLEKEALARQTMANRLLPSLMQPEIAAIPAQYYGQETQMPLMDDEGNMMPGAAAPVAGRAAGLNQDVFKALSASPEGQKSLLNFVNLQKALAGETTSVAADTQLIRTNPLTGKIEVVASGSKKPQLLTGTESNIALRLFGTNDPTQLTKEQNEMVGKLSDKPPLLTGTESNIALRMFGTNDPTKLTKEQNEMVGKLSKEARKESATVVYPPGALAPDKGVAKDLQTSLLESGSRLSMYNQIESQFKPEYLQPKFKAGQAWSAIKEKSGANLAPEEKQSLAQFSQFKQNTLNNLSQTIKALTGASMGIQEAARIEAGLPSAGQGIFDGDSPTEFQAKLNNTMKELRLVEARNAYILRKGLSFKDVPLDNVPKLINDRAAELAKQYQVDLKKATPTQMNAIKRQLSVEFGISAD